MAKNLRWTDKDLRDKKLVERDGVFVPIDSVTNFKKVNKLPNLLERALLQVPQAVKPIGNKKIKNATKSVVDGVSFDSNLEKYLYFLLKDAGINFEFQKKFELQPKFKYNGESIRSICSIVDFWISDHNLIADAKGYANDIAPVKYKMLKFKFAMATESGKRKRRPPSIEMPKNQTQCRDLIERIKAGEFL